jgi:hypothetical protein
MVRRYAEPVIVTTRARTADGAGEPVTFVWRGRRYAVCAVLAQWQQRRAWWRDVLDPHLDSRLDSQLDRGGSAPAGARIAAAARERRVWRVEAGLWRPRAAGVGSARAAGVGSARAAGVGPSLGVFELACDDTDPPAWQVLRIAD